MYFFSLIKFIWLRFEAKKLSIVRIHFRHNILIPKCCIMPGWTSVEWLKSDFKMNLKRTIKFLPRSVFQLVIFVLNCTLYLFLCASFWVFPQILKKCPLGNIFKGQFRYRCGIGAMARPGSSPAITILNPLLSPLEQFFGSPQPSVSFIFHHLLERNFPFRLKKFEFSNA